jgi:hypothetical protein
MAMYDDVYLILHGGERQTGLENVGVHCIAK